MLADIKRQAVIGQLQGLGAVAVDPLRLMPVAGANPEPAWIAEGASAPLARLTSTSTFAPTTSYMLLLAVLKEVLRIGDPRARNYILSRVCAARWRG